LFGSVSFARAGWLAEKRAALPLEERFRRVNVLLEIQLTSNT
jgi:hypothetical protein